MILCFDFEILKDIGDRKIPYRMFFNIDFNLMNQYGYPLVNKQFAIEHGPFSYCSLIYQSKMVSFHRFRYVYQRLINVVPQVAVITGASTGIGLATVEGLLKSGAGASASVRGGEKKQARHLIHTERVFLFLFRFCYVIASCCVCFFWYACCFCIHCALLGGHIDK